MLKGFLTKIGVKKLINSVRLAGMTVAEHLTVNRNNTKRVFKDVFKRNVMAEASPKVYSEQLDKIIKTRKRQTRTTHQNIQAANRAKMRERLARNKKGTWFNNGVMDAKTTKICAGYMGASWPTSEFTYAEIPDKPPRVGETPHPCRSSLVFVPEGETRERERPFMEQFNEDEDLQRELLGKTRYEAYKSGELKIDSFVQYENSVLNTLEDLGI